MPSEDEAVNPGSHFGQQGQILDPSPRTTQQLYREISSVEDKLINRFDGKIGVLLSRVEAMERAERVINDNYTRVPTLLDRAMQDIKELLFSKLDNLDHMREARFTEVAARFGERDIRFKEQTDASKNDLALALQAAEDKLLGIVAVTDEKFASVARQFVERDVRTEQAAVATKIAVDAALQAQKEAAGAQNESNAAAITKSEAATAKQLDGITILLNSNKQALDDKIADLKGRLDRGEGVTIQQHDQVARTFDNTVVSQGHILNQGQSNANIIATIACVLAFLALAASFFIPHLSH
jgi:hypothetical protein